MPAHSLSAQLELFGPQASPQKPTTLAEAEQYCRRLACQHYENFTVASWLLPKPLRQPFYNIYSYCRWADDLADETGDTGQSLMLLDWWQQQLDECYRGRAKHPVFVALTTTIEEFQIPRDPFSNLLIAFRQDQRKRRYDTYDELLGYCQNSANPVGQLVLYLGRCHNEENCRLSDSICTGLQLANFWQDVARDYDCGRIYLSREACLRFQYDDTMLENRQYNDQFQKLLASEVDRAELCLQAGLPLIESVSSELRIEIDLFIHGGLAILDSIRRIQFNVWRQRPQVGKLTKLKLLASAWKRSRKRS